MGTEEQLRARLEALQREYAAGQTRLRELEAQQTSISQTLLRIEGAIALIREMLEQAPAPESACDEEAAP